MLPERPSPPPRAAVHGAPHTGAVSAWRRALRERLLAEREALGPRVRQRASRKVVALLSEDLPALHRETVALYWPFRGELDLRTLAGDARTCALPVVVARGAPLVFRRWRPGMRLARGVWNIPIPADGEAVVPDVVIAPLVGFDAGGYRLGYGGGYYDRTLAALQPRPLVIGVGFDAAALETIDPQPHDVPMDLIVTESGVRDFREVRRAAGRRTRTEAA